MLCFIQIIRLCSAGLKACAWFLLTRLIPCHCLFPHHDAGLIDYSSTEFLAFFFLYVTSRLLTILSLQNVPWSTLTGNVWKHKHSPSNVNSRTSHIVNGWGNRIAEIGSQRVLRWDSPGLKRKYEEKYVGKAGYCCMEWRGLIVRVSWKTPGQPSHPFAGTGKQPSGVQASVRSSLKSAVLTRSHRLLSLSWQGRRQTQGCLQLCRVLSQTLRIQAECLLCDYHVSHHRDRRKPEKTEGKNEQAARGQTTGFPTLHPTTSC